ncbi:MAG: dihydrolipoyl dehydrogenase [Methylomicrobium sp.]
MPNRRAKYDVIIIGAGPAGYVTAIRCGQLGLKTACIDSCSDKSGRPNLGGAYLNGGCIASMALLESAKIYHLLSSELKQHGISVENLSLDVGRMVERKDQIVSEINRHIAGLFNFHKIDHIHAKGRLLQAGLVEIQPLHGGAASYLTADHIILAAGSRPLALPCAPLDQEYIIDTGDALNLDSVPKSLGIIGAGIKGLEIASIWNRLGSEVILLEAQENFLNLPDQHISREAYRIFTDQGMEMRLGARVVSARKTDKKVMIEYQDSEGDNVLHVDRMIVAIGRKPNSEGLAAPEADLLLDDSGYVHVDENCRTNLPGVYAIGDMTLLGPMLAHKGIEEGVFVAEQIAGLHPMINYDLLPSVIYTEPEIAWVGQTEQALRALGEPVKVGFFPMNASPRALTMGRTEGLVKIIAHAETDKILGVHIIGSHASELIAEAVLAMEFSASSEDLGKTIHAHPTLSEALYESALALKKMALHLPMIQ